MTPSFSDLTYFYEAANCLNLSQAAKKLGVTQPSLSIAINRLENLLSTSLFIRHRQGVTLTKSGEKLKNHVSDLILKWKNTESSIHALSNEVSGKISIGCLAAMAPHLSQLTADLLTKHPMLEIQFINDLSAHMTDGVIAGTLDIAIVYDPVKHPDLIMRKIKDIELSFWRSKTGATNDNVVICDPQVFQIQKLLKDFENYAAAPRICSVKQYEMTAHLAASGAGLGIMPSCLVGKKYNDILARVEHAPAIICEMYLIFRGENRNLQAREVVLTALKNAIPV